MRALLLESPLTLIIVALLATGAAFIAWRYTRHDLARKAFVVIGLGGVGLVISNLAVETAAERAQAFLTRVTAAVEAQGFAGALPFIDRRYNFAGVTYAELQRTLTPRTKMTVSQTRVSDVAAEWAGDDIVTTFDCRATVAGTVEGMNFSDPTGFSRWRVRLRTQNGEPAAIVEIEVIEARVGGRSLHDFVAVLKEL